MGIQTRPNTLHVAVGVVCNDRCEVLIARRHDNAHQGGLWEFPGGKVESDETAEDALRRELAEELSIAVTQARPLIKIRHDYGDRQVLLDVWRVESFDGEPNGRENQPIRWVEADQLRQYEFPAANRPIIAAARLPEYYPIIDGEPNNIEALFRRLERAARRRFRLAQWRLRIADDARFLELAHEAVNFCRPRGLELLLNADPNVASQTGAAGVHLNSRRLMALNHRPLSDRHWVAASCHCPEEINHARRLGIDFVVLSPVLYTLSHPEVAPLGWDHFGAWASAASLPVYALGGMTPEHLRQAQQRGAIGIAGIRGLVDE